MSVSDIATIAVAGVTALLALVTWLMVREMKTARELSLRPILAVRPSNPQPTDGAESRGVFAVHNVGNSPALHIGLSLSLDIDEVQNFDPPLPPGESPFSRIPLEVLHDISPASLGEKESFEIRYRIDHNVRMPSSMIRFHIVFAYDNAYEIGFETDSMLSLQHRQDLDTYFVTRVREDPTRIPKQRRRWLSTSLTRLSHRIRRIHSPQKATREGLPEPSRDTDSIVADD